MKNSKETRTCISCRKKDNKKNLIRIVNTEEKGVIIDINQNIKSRGAYICNSEACFNKLIKSNGLSRALKANISKEKYKELRGVMLDR